MSIAKPIRPSRVRAASRVPRAGTGDDRTLRLMNGNAGALGVLRRGPGGRAPSRSGGRTVLIVEDDAGVRDALEKIVGSSGFEVETFASAEEMLERTGFQRPACLVVDVRLPGISGLAMLRELSARRVTVPVIMMSGYADVPTAVEAMRYGAIDFFEKPFSFNLMLDRVRAALTEDAARCVAEAKSLEAGRRVALLTPREREVMEFVVAGKRNKETASELRIAEKTVEVHRMTVMRKMGVDSVAELVRLSLAHGDGPRS